LSRLEAVHPREQAGAAKQIGLGGAFIAERNAGINRRKVGCHVITFSRSPFTVHLSK
jgi:hypothetical protein